MELIRKYPLDVSGKSPNNLVVGEPHQLIETPNNQHRVIVPNYGGFYTDHLKVYDDTLTLLTPRVDYIATYLFEDATELTGLEVCGAVVIINPQISKDIYIDYQVVGGNYAMSTDALEQVLKVLENNNRPVEWGAIVGKPTEYPPGGHLHALWELYGFEYMVVQLDRLVHAILMGDQAALDELRDYAYALYEDAKRYTDALDDRFKLHAADTSNPHRVTKAQVGLGSVANYPVASLLEVEAGVAPNRYITVDRMVHGIEHHLGKAFKVHLADYGNPHRVTKAQVGLGNVENLLLSTKSIAEQGTSNDRYMTPLRVKEAVTYQVGNAFNDHVANVSNPHKVTKAQVGLGSVENYGISNQTEAELGERSDRYMTPLRTKQAIAEQALKPLNAHLADAGNPHRVTKAQVGLGSVENYSIASKGEAESGNSNTRYMTPLRVKEAIDLQAGAKIDAHERRADNPHKVTKAQVGLGSVQNMGLASTAQAVQGTLHTVYMTPLRVKEAIDSQVGGTLDSHIANVNNPHNVTKAQVGLSSVPNYSAASATEAVSTSINNRLMTPLRTYEAIAAHAITPLNAHANARNNPHNVTKAQVGLGNVDNFATATQAQAEQGTVTNRFMTPQRTAQAIAKLAGEGLDTHTRRTDNPHSVTKTQVGLSQVENYTVASKGEAEAGTRSDRYMTPLRTKEAITSQAGSLLNSHTSARNNPHNVTKAQVGLSQVENYRVASKAESEAGTSSVFYMTPQSVRWAIDHRAAAMLKDHTDARNNPHNVTKAQVGLGNVDNFATATQAQAEQGTVTNRFMTPQRTKEAITSQAGSLLKDHTDARNNPHNVTKAQVGLSQVENYTVASKGEAEAGTRSDRYMTPLRTKEAITSQAASLLNSHTSNRNNPHGVTKAQVGLNNVENYRPATRPEAEAGTSSIFYMTPQSVRWAIDVRAPVLIKDHTDQRNNPHGVTKAQVGLGSVQNYAVASAAEAREGTANDRYMTPLRTRNAFGPAFDAYVTNGFTIPRTGSRARIDFPSNSVEGREPNDPGFIEHHELVNGKGTSDSCMRFSVSDDGAPGTGIDGGFDRFELGAMQGSSYITWMRIERHITQIWGDLSVSQNIQANDLYLRSDMRYKKDIVPLEGALEKVRRLDGFDYTMMTNGERQTGISAQALQKVLPNSVRLQKEGTDEEYLSITLAGPVALLIEANKELSDQVTTLSSELSEMKKVVARLEANFQE